MLYEMPAKRRLVGFRRTSPPATYRALSDYIMLDGELVNRFTLKPARDEMIEAVYEGDPGWEEFTRHARPAG